MRRLEADGYAIVATVASEARGRQIELSLPLDGKDGVLNG
jgi:hypothetical protein